MKRYFLTAFCGCFAAMTSFSQAGRSHYSSGFQPINISNSPANQRGLKVHTDLNTRQQFVDGSGMTGFIRPVKTNILGEEIPLIQTPIYHQDEPYYRPSEPSPTTSEGLIRQANSTNPYYRFPGDNRSIQQINEDRILEQHRNDPAYNPALRNPNSNHYSRNSQQELFNRLQDVYAHEAVNGEGKMRTENYASPEFAAKTKPYADALKAIKDMLSGKRKLSVAQAYFTMEDAYGESYLTQQEFNSIIRETVDFIKVWMQQNGLNLNDNEAKHYAIQKVMSERTFIAKSNPTKDNGEEIEIISHDPFFYDFNDNGGEKDHRNFFVTKCFATGMGQCNSMPAVYLCLAEGLGATAYLSHAPQHALIKFPDNSGNIRNYEPTSNWDISDRWYLDDMFISPKAQQNGVYLSPMDSRQIVADCAVQLAFGYHRRFGAADGKFETDCINTAKPYFPRNNNSRLLFSYSNLYGYQLGQVMRKNGIDQLSDIEKLPEAMALYQKWLENENQIEALGYEENPPGLYEEMMKYHEFRGRVQEGYNISGKEKRSLFTKTIKK